jgi:phosphoribosylformylglycinamidine synthase
MTSPKLFVFHAPGSNRDGEAAWAATQAGFDAEIVHVAQVVDQTRPLTEPAAVILPGGFSYGDALGAGVGLALDLRLDLVDALRGFVERGGMLLGICNGFQALVKSGLLAGPASTNGSTNTGARTITLTHNERERFECRWVHLELNTASAATWLSSTSELIHCPVAHGEGRFLAADDTVVRQLESDGLIVFRYVDEAGAPAKGRYPINPNGSVADIAGVCDPTGRIVGLMPHPEDHILDRQRPFGPPGQRGSALFESMYRDLRAAL